LFVAVSLGFNFNMEC